MPSLGKLIPRFTKATDHQITEARGYGYTLQEIGAHLGIHYATVSRRAGRYKRLAKGKKEMQKTRPDPECECAENMMCAIVYDNARLFLLFLAKSSPKSACPKIQKKISDDIQKNRLLFFLKRSSRYSPDSE